MLAGLLVLLGLLGVLNGRVQCSHDCGAGPKAVHGAGLDERLEDALVHQPQVNALAELPKRRERSLIWFCAGGEDALDGVVADILNGGEAEADGLDFLWGLGRWGRPTHPEVARLNRARSVDD